MDFLQQVAWSPDGTRFLTTHLSALKEVYVYDTRTGELSLPPLKCKADAEWAAFSPDGRRIVTGDSAGTIQFWDAQTGKTLPLQIQHAAGISSLAFNRDGTKLAVGSKDRSARLWNTRTGEPLTPALRHGDEVNEVHFNPDGHRVLTASLDGTARVWDALTGKPVTPSLVVKGLGRHWAQFSSDGRLVLTRRESSVRVWDAETGVPITPLISSDKDFVGAAISADTRRLLVLSEDGELRSSDIARLDWSVDDWLFAAQFLSCQTVDATEGLSPWAPLVASAPGTNITAHLQRGWLRLRERLAELR
jgi:WD40 repeat protein